MFKRFHETHGVVFCFVLLKEWKSAVLSNAALVKIIEICALATRSRILALFFHVSFFLKILSKGSNQWVFVAALVFKFPSADLVLIGRMRPKI